MRRTNAAWAGVLLLAGLVATPVAAQDDAAPPAQGPPLTQLAARLEASLALVTPDDPREDMTVQARFVLAAADPALARKLADGLKNPDRQRAVRYAALAGELVASPGTAAAQLAGLKPEDMYEAVRVATQVLARRDLTAADAVAAAVPHASLESIARAGIALSVAPTDPASAVAAARKVEAQERREAAFWRLAQAVPVEQLDQVTALEASTFGHPLAAAMLAVAALRLAESDEAGARELTDRGLRRWYQAKEGSLVTPPMVTVLARAVVRLRPGQASAMARSLQPWFARQSDMAVPLAVLAAEAPDEVAAVCISVLDNAPKTGNGALSDYMRQTLLAVLAGGAPAEAKARLEGKPSDDLLAWMLARAAQAGPGRAVALLQATGWKADDNILGGACDRLPDPTAEQIVELTGLMESPDQRLWRLRYLARRLLPAEPARALEVLWRLPMSGTTMLGYDLATYSYLAELQERGKGEELLAMAQVNPAAARLGAVMAGLAGANAARSDRLAARYAAQASEQLRQAVREGSSSGVEEALLYLAVADREMALELLDLCPDDAPGGWARQRVTTGLGVLLLRDEGWLLPEVTPW